LACSVDGSHQGLIDQPATPAHSAEGDVPVTGDGDHTVSCTADDSAGHSVTATRSFEVQSTVPIVTLVNPSAGTVTSNRKPTFDGAAGRAGGDQSAVTLKIYSGTSATGSPVQTLNATASAADGSWTVAPATNLA